VNSSKLKKLGPKVLEHFSAIISFERVEAKISQVINSIQLKPVKSKYFLQFKLNFVCK